YLGTFSPWSPQMSAWSAEQTPFKYIAGRTPLERQGALVLQNKQCRNCHALNGSGGLRGAPAGRGGTPLTGGQVARQVIQGGGNMPAYGKNLSPAEVAALVAFMKTLRGPNEIPAQDSTSPAQPGQEQKKVAQAAR